MTMMEEVKALECGRGIQSLLDSAYSIFKNPMYVIDVYYNLLAFTDVPVDDPVWNELITTGSFSTQTLEILASEGFIEEISNADKSILLKSDKFKLSRLCNFFFNAEKTAVGIAAMYDSNVPIEGDYIAAFEAFTEKITEEVQSHDYFAMLAMSFYEDKINNLLDGSVKNPLISNPDVQLLYNGFDDYLYVAVVQAEQKNKIDMVHQSRLEYFQSMLKTFHPLFKYSIYSNHIVILLSSKHMNANISSVFSAAAALFEQNGLSMGISHGFENLYDLRIYYDQAALALKRGLEDKGSRGLFFSYD